MSCTTCAYRGACFHWAERHCFDYRPDGRAPVRLQLRQPDQIQLQVPPQLTMPVALPCPIVA